MAVWAAKSEGWLWPLNTLASFFRLLLSIANGLRGAFYDFVVWAQRIEKNIVEFVTKSWVFDFFSDPLYHLNQLWVWFLSWASNVTSIVSNWWRGVQSTVLGWVEATKTYALGLVNNLQGMFNSLQSSWNSFTGTVLPSLASRFDVEALIKSAFAPWADLFNFWGKVGGEIKAFFADPLQWAYNKMDEFFERFW